MAILQECWLVSCCHIYFNPQFSTFWLSFTLISYHFSSLSDCGIHLKKTFNSCPDSPHSLPHWPSFVLTLTSLCFGIWIRRVFLRSSVPYPQEIHQTCPPFTFVCQICHSLASTPHWICSPIRSWSSRFWPTQNLHFAPIYTLLLEFSIQLSERKDQLNRQVSLEQTPWWASIQATHGSRLSYPKFSFPDLSRADRTRQCVFHTASKFCQSLVRIGRIGNPFWNLKPRKAPFEPSRDHFSSHVGSDRTEGEKSCLQLPSGILSSQGTFFQQARTF